jgi:hypothetical protein
MAIKRVKAPFAAIVRGVPRSYTTGQLVDESDPVVKGREHLFEDVEAHVGAGRGRVEEATAGPGEKRAVTRPQRPVRRTKGKGEGQ